MLYTAEDIRQLNNKIQYQAAFIDRLRDEVGRGIVGQHQMPARLLIGLLSNGHVLLEGVPGLAKTLAIKSLAQAIHAKFSRIQFTPDLLPADVIGTMIYNQQKHEFVVRKGPSFANFLLADEINRAPAKVQSALLEAMEERQVTLGDSSHPLPEPFMVLATQNPIEQEGTYPLAEAQVDRFMMKLRVGYPTRAEEGEILERMLVERDHQASPILDGEHLVALRAVGNTVYLDHKIRGYILDLITATRDPRAA